MKDVKPRDQDIRNLPTIQRPLVLATIKCQNHDQMVRMARRVKERVGRGLGAATYLSDQQQGREVKKRIRTTAVRNAANELRYMKKKRPMARQVALVSKIWNSRISDEMVFNPETRSLCGKTMFYYYYYYYYPIIHPEPRDSV